MPADRYAGPMPAFDDAPDVQPDDRAGWRAWLEANHATARSAWLVIYRAGSGKHNLDYEAAVEEALCFGWVDSRGGKLDDERTKLYFAPRNPRSGWAGYNKERIERLMRAGRMAPAGLAAVETAKRNGTWTVLDGASRLEVPDDLAAELAKHDGARAAWDAFPKSARRAALEQVALARRPETRAKRIRTLVDQARRNEKPGQWPPKG